MLAWTTTPWTLPSNLALCVHPAMQYVKLRDKKGGQQYWIARSRVEELYPSKRKGPAQPQSHRLNKDDLEAADEDESKTAAAARPAPAPAAASSAPLPSTEEYEVLEQRSGQELVGLTYQPIFPYFAAQSARGAFRVIPGEFVTEDSGTGIVHCAPGHGEDDYAVCMQAGIVRKGETVTCPVDGSGRFTAEVTDFAGQYVKDADKEIIRALKASGRLVKQSQLDHSYPHCWRSETPLLQLAIPSWFVSVESIKAELLACNAQTYWVPSFVKERRFHNWLRDARDWAISRSRYWGTPLPIWTSDDGAEVLVISSVQQLEQLSGVSGITDLHKDKIDHITIPSQQGKGRLTRVPEVFDCIAAGTPVSLSTGLSVPIETLAGQPRAAADARPRCCRAGPGLCSAVGLSSRRLASVHRADLLRRPHAGLHSRAPHLHSGRRRQSGSPRSRQDAGGSRW